MPPTAPEPPRRDGQQEKQRPRRGELETEEADHAAFSAAAALARAVACSTSLTIVRASLPISRARSAVTGRRANFTRSASPSRLARRCTEKSERGRRKRTSSVLVSDGNAPGNRSAR